MSHGLFTPAHAYPMKTPRNSRMAVEHIRGIAAVSIFCTRPGTRWLFGCYLRGSNDALGLPVVHASGESTIRRPRCLCLWRSGAMAGRDGGQRRPARS